MQQIKNRMTDKTEYEYKGLSLYISVAGGISLLLFIISLFFEYTRDNVSPYLILCWFVSMPVALEIHKLGGGK